MTISGPADPSPLTIEHGTPGATSRGQRTQDKLIRAAERVFTRKGFLETRMSDIAKQAKVAHGTVYTYFDAKEDIFLAVATRAVEDIIERSVTIDSADGSDPYERIRAAADSVVSAYQEHAVTLGSLAIVASFDERANTLRHFLTLQLIDRAERVINAFQRAGLADKTLNRRAVATALGAMVESFAHVALVQSNDLSRDEIVDALTLVWIRSIGIGTTRPPARRRKTST